MLEAAQIESSVSFNDRLCLVVCRAKGWTCVTNDGALRRLCRRHCVDTLFGLGLMVDLVAAGRPYSAASDGGRAPDSGVEPIARQRPRDSTLRQ